MLLKEKEFLHFLGFWSQGHRHWMKMESFHGSFKVVGSLKTLKWATWGRRWLVDEELRGWREASQKRRRWGRGWGELALPAAMEVITTPWQWLDPSYTHSYVPFNFVLVLPLINPTWSDGTHGPRPGGILWRGDRTGTAGNGTLKKLRTARKRNLRKKIRTAGNGTLETRIW